MIDTFPLALPHGITLSCRAAGQRGRPVLVFLHGFPEAAFVWDELLAHFARPENGGYRCVAPNLRGFERSSAPPEPAAYRAKHLVQDLVALIQAEGAPVECLVAHDWGGAVGWNFANQQPGLLKRLAIVNSPHPGTFLRELKDNPDQQRASAYMNFLVRPDAERLLAEDGYRRLWRFFEEPAWLDDATRRRYEEVWNGAQGGPPGAGLVGGCNYYRASPLRPRTEDDPGVSAVTLPREMLTVGCPTLVLWALEDSALLPSLVEGLDEYVPRLTLERVPGATHWIVHERPAFVAQRLQAFLAATA